MGLVDVNSLSRQKFVALNCVGCDLRACKAWLWGTTHVLDLAKGHELRAERDCQAWTASDTWLRGANRVRDAAAEREMRTRPNYEARTAYNSWLLGADWAKSLAAGRELSASPATSFEACAGWELRGLNNMRSLVTRSEPRMGHGCGSEPCTRHEPHARRGCWAWTACDT